MKKFVHNQFEVEAVQLVRPYRSFTTAFPRSHPVTSQAGKIMYYHMVDGGKAYPGDFVLKHGDGTVEVLTEAEFTRRYEAVE